MPGRDLGQKKQESYSMRDMFRVHVQVTRYLLESVALMPQGKLNLSQRVAFLTDAPEIESHKPYKIRLLLLLQSVS